ncbi:class I SAM-dependent methyltransferase [Blastococcus mobilis]|nr:methyltransferase domain-containing protein [Blastococcus mobilis]
MSVKQAVSPYVHAGLSRALRPARKRAFREQFEAARRSGPVRVNIGCGRKPIEGWINTDVVWQADAYLDVTQPWPVPAGSVDYIYADNVIEHIPLEIGRAVFRHAYEALKPGGVFRLATPDVEAVARQYLENGELARAGMERNRERGKDFVHPVQLIRETFVGAKHYLGFCYDLASIRAEMAPFGFVVERVPAGTSEHAALSGLEVRMHPAEQATALIVEGRKPVDRAA